MDSEELILLEEKFILENNAVLDKEYYNISYSGNGGDNISYHPELKRIKSIRKKQMSGSGNHQFEKAKSDKMIESVKDSNRMEIMIDNVYYESLKDASEKLCIGVSTICYRLSSKSSKFDNYVRLKESRCTKGNTKNKPIAIEIDGDKFNSISEASKVLGFTVPYIKHRLYSDEFKNYIIVDDLNK